MKTDCFCMMTPSQAAICFLLALSDPKLSDIERERLAELWNDDVRRNRHED